MKTIIMLTDKLEEVYNKIRQIRDNRGDDKCWKDWEELYKMLPEGYSTPERDESVELEFCKKYIESCHNPNVKYVSPQRRIEELESELKELKYIFEYHLHAMQRSYDLFTKRMDSLSLQQKN